MMQEKEVDNGVINDPLTYIIIGCAMKVHRELGQGFQEVIYQRCLAIEMEKVGLTFSREKECNIYYDGQIVGTRRADFIINNKVIVELKALINIEEIHFLQSKNYLVLYNFPTGLLINFGAPSLQVKKLFNPKYQPPNPIKSN
jgi:GxxExxY protein